MQRRACAPLLLHGGAWLRRQKAADSLLAATSSNSGAIGIAAACTVTAGQPAANWRRCLATEAAQSGGGGEAAAAAAAAQRLKPGGRDIDYQSPARQLFSRVFGLALPAAMLGTLAWGFLAPDDGGGAGGAASPRQVPVGGEVVTNWSGTHTVQPKAYYAPETQDDVEAIVADCHARGRRVRVVGSALSPNGAAFSDDAMMSMALLDRVLWVDPASGLARVEAGCRVQQVADALKPHGLALANYASIREQQIGGFTQVSAHGTGARVPPVDAQVVAMKVVTPGKGVLELSADNDPTLFRLARVGLGLLGVVTEVTLQAVPLAPLVERTFTATRAEVERNHAKWLKSNRHLRYMWLPYTDAVVVVQVNPASSPAAAARAAAEAEAAAKERPGAEAAAAAPMRALLEEKLGPSAAAEAAAMSPTQLRDALLAADPLNRDWVARVNAAEAEFWRRSAGVRVGAPDEILGFDCGGQQWVLEVAFLVGPLARVGGWGAGTPRDIQYMKDLMAEIEAAGIPAPCPIEQRWTAASDSPMSPAARTSPAAPRDEVHSWVGVIMYLPPDDEPARARITDAFRRYAALVEERLMPKYGATWHWAKIEPPRASEDGGGKAEAGAEAAAAGARLARMRGALAARFPLREFADARRALDPKNVLGSDLYDQLLAP